MVRHVRDPWAKKTRKGMKSLSTMAKVGGVLGAAAYSEMKKTKIQTQNADFSSMHPAGWVTFIIGVIIAAIVMGNAGNFILGFIYFFGILFLTVFVSVIVSLIFSNYSNSDSTSELYTENTQTIESHYSIDIANSITDLIVNMNPIEEINKIVEQIQSYEEKKETVKQALDLALNKINSQDIITPGMENYIDSYMEKYSLNDDETTHSDKYVEFIKSLIVQDMLNGVTSKRITLNPCPINMQAGEIPIWPFQNVVYYEEESKRTMVGASRGVNVRIAKGIYYRVGAFKGEPLITSYLQAKYGGDLILTNKNIYFYSRAKSMKFPYNKIISFVPFEDGLGIQQDKATANPVYFKGIDGRFAFNIVSNINNLK